jgi:hypothetical protein
VRNFINFKFENIDKLVFIFRIYSLKKRKKFESWGNIY